MSEVVVVVGPGSIGQAIARRVSAGKHVLLADLHEQNAEAAAENLADAGFDVSTATVDVASRASIHAVAETAVGLGDVTGLIHAAGVSPSQAPIDAILAVDLYGTRPPRRDRQRHRTRRRRHRDRVAVRAPPRRPHPRGGRRPRNPHPPTSFSSSPCCSPTG